MNPLSANPPDILKFLGHDLRWKLITALGQSDLRVQELVALLDQPQNLVSYHLRQLRDSDLVTEHRSAADARDVYYSLDLERVHHLYIEMGRVLHPAFTSHSPLAPVRDYQYGEQPLRVLFLCTHNAARSQMAEGILRHLSNNTIEVFSAGSHPATVHPMAVSVLQPSSIDISQQRSKHMDEFSGQHFDYLITVCDRVRELCPTFPGELQTIHWSLSDPILIEGSEGIQYQAFEKLAQQLTTRIRYLLINISYQRHTEGQHL